MRGRQPSVLLLLGAALSPAITVSKPGSTVKGYAQEAIDATWGANLDPVATAQRVLAELGVDGHVGREGDELVITLWQREEDEDEDEAGDDTPA